MNIDLTGKLAVITGASQGIGAAIARAFHGANASVAINHPGLGSSRTDAEKLADELNAKRPDSAWAVTADVAKAEAVRRKPWLARGSWISIRKNSTGATERSPWDIRSVAAERASW